MSSANDYSGGRNILRAAVLIKTTRAGCPEDETSGGETLRGRKKTRSDGRLSVFSPIRGIPHRLTD